MKIMSADGSKMKETPTAGFIAQELDEMQTSENAEWLNLVLKDNPDKWEAAYGNLLPVVVKAMQELKTENDELRAESKMLKVESEELKTVNEEMKIRMLKLEQAQNFLAGELRKFKLTGNQTKQVKSGEKK